MLNTEVQLTEDVIGLTIDEALEYLDYLESRGENDELFDTFTGCPELEQ